ncbi:hypothetical protein Tco_1255888 [Tanacetum coccineum]
MISSRPDSYQVDEPMVGPIVDEIAEPIVEAEEQMIALVVDMYEDIAMLFGDDDFEDDGTISNGRIELSKGVNLIPTLRRDPLEEVEIPKVGGS